MTVAATARQQVTTDAKVAKRTLEPAVFRMTRQHYQNAVLQRSITHERNLVTLLVEEGYMRRKSTGWVGKTHKRVYIVEEADYNADMVLGVDPRVDKLQVGTVLKMRPGFEASVMQEVPVGFTVQQLYHQFH